MTSENGQMSRTKWSTFTVVTVVSAIICLLALAAWVRSIWAAEGWLFWPRGIDTPAGMSGAFRSSRWIGSSKGQLIIADLTFPESSAAQRFLETHRCSGYLRADSAKPLLPPFPMTISAENHMEATGVRFHRLNLSCVAPGFAGQYREREIRIEWWVVVAVSFVLPLVWQTRRLVIREREISRRRKLEKSICITCGYDMRATPERCPECGGLQVQLTASRPVPRVA
jgi:hypothetical protein